jgi:hypothetical protein
VAFGFSQKAAAAMIYNMLDYEIEGAIAAVKDQMRKGKAKNPKAMLKTALKERWSTNANPSTSEEIIQPIQKIDQNETTKNLSKSEEVVQKPQKTARNRSTFLKIFDGLFNR